MRPLSLDGNKAEGGAEVRLHIDFTAEQFIAIVSDAARAAEAAEISIGETCPSGSAGPLAERIKAVLARNHTHGPYCPVSTMTGRLPACNCWRLDILRALRPEAEAFEATR